MLSFVNDFPGTRTLIHDEENGVDLLRTYNRMKVCAKADIDNSRPLNNSKNETKIALDIFMTAVDQDGNVSAANIATFANCRVSKTDGHIVITFVGAE